MERPTKFVDVILPVAVPNLYTYRVPMELNNEVIPGQRVVVEFGRRKRYSALIRKVHAKAPEMYQAKYIDAVLDSGAIVTEQQFVFWEWLASYYMCTLGEVMLSALPSALKLASETKIVSNPEFDRNYDHLTDKEFLIADAVEVRSVLSLLDIADILDLKTVYPVVKSLLDKKVVLLEEQLKERYKPRVENYVKLSKQYSEEENLKEAFDILGKAPKQLELLMRYIEQSKRYSDSPKEVNKVKLQKLANATSAQVAQLVKKGVFELYEKEIGRIQELDETINPLNPLNEEQEEALQKIDIILSEKRVCLLHGVTGSGKTEVYVRKMLETIKNGGKVLYLVPEIALTTQLIHRLKKHFGNKIGVYHSKFNANERVEIWNKVLEGDKYDVVIGARSAMFLPFQDLDLIIIDEEHENSFKQYDPAPRYNARDASIVLAGIAKAKVILGTATPSVETYWNAKEGTYGIATLNNRFGGLKLPEVFCADIKEEKRKRKMSGHFTSFLLSNMREALDNGEQIILFQNRRGYAPHCSCEECGWVPQCTRCDVSLTYHKFESRLSCHYCGYGVRPPRVCEGCGSHKLNMIGFGTEKIEEELGSLLSDAKIARMDLDTTRSKNAYQDILQSFENREIDVLVGTQMVTKGLDFDNVSLVGILNADQMLNFPDFRAFERSYQLMAQVSGRAGRKKKRGKVVIQTWNPNHWIVQKVMANDFLGMYRQELLERKNFNYPPFYRLVLLTVKNKDKVAAETGAKALTGLLQKQLQGWVLGPEFPAISKVRNYYLLNILIKFDRKASPSKIKKYIDDQVIEFNQNKELKSCLIRVDVDPI